MNWRHIPTKALTYREQVKFALTEADKIVTDALIAYRYKLAHIVKTYRPLEHKPDGAVKVAIILCSSAQN